MVNILIVDDEIHAVEGIRSGVAWDKLGISAVYTAFTARQAKDVLRSETIDIILCDIEMPQASGLELTEWVREHYPKTETIFLTCHADFKYAKQALQLGSLDYILKPIPFTELEKVIMKAKAKISRDKEIAQYSQYGQFWFQQQPMLIERFWQDILNQTIPSNPEAVSRAAADRKISYVKEMIFLPVLISVQRWHKPLSLRDEKILEYGLKNSAEEILLGTGNNGQIISLGNKRLLVILSAEGYSQTEQPLKPLCERYIEACNQYFYCAISCYIGEQAHGHEVYRIVNQLYALEKNNVAYNNKVFSLSDPQTESSGYQPADMSVWSVMLEEGAYQEVLRDATLYLDRLMEKDALNATRLLQFYQDFQQMIYYRLQTKGIQAHQLFSEPESQELSQNATRSVINLTDWMNHTIHRAMDYVHSIQQSQSVVDKVIHYIKLHISADLSREDIANYVYLNPDYLSRIFKKETGMAISDFLYQERLKLAQELLAKTDMSIASVAAHIGYANFSHFSRTFKKHTKMNPNEYRQIQQKDNGRN